MRKEHYTKLINDKKWKWAKEHFDALNTYVPKKLTKVDVDPEEWIKFSMDYFNDANQNYVGFKPNCDDFTCKLTNLHADLGRNVHNSFGLNYGINGETNQKMIDMFGKNNLGLVNLRPDFLFFNLFVKLPGHGVTWHVDTNGAFIKMFRNELQINNETQTCQHGQIKRLWFPVTDWDNGHIFQISETVIANWQPGDVYEIPHGMGHCSSNAGYVPQMTVSLTGIIND